MNKNLMSPIWLAVAIPFALGAGLPALLVLALLGCLLTWGSTVSKNCNLSERGMISWIYLTLVGLFITLYVTQRRVDLFPVGFSLPASYFVKVLGASALVVLLPLFLKNQEDSLFFLGGIALGAFVRAGATVLLTMYYLPPPYHGKIFDLKTWAEGNSPAFANMLILAVAFFGALLANARSLGLNKKYKLLSCFVVFAGATLGSFLQARLFFIVVFFVCPILFLVNYSLVKTKKNYIIPGLLIFVFLFGFVAIYWSGLMQRGSEIDGLFSDLRFSLYKSFWQQIVTNPWQHAQLNLSVVQINGIVQFHNFFADVQRVSGTWAFLASIFLMLYTICLILVLARKGSVYGKIFLYVMIPCLLVLLTSVEPEGGGQVYLTMLAMGSIAANELNRINHA
ncbi:MAG: hypothetical protein ACOYBQ_09810 [Fluviibacter sp.]